MRSAPLLVLLAGCGLDWTVGGGTGAGGRTSASSTDGASASATGAGSGAAGGGDTSSSAGIGSGPSSSTAGGPTGSTATSSTASTGGDPPMCDQGNCPSCIDCGIGAGGPCEGLEAICQANPECLAIETCATPCMDPGCVSLCYAMHPGGQFDWDQVDACLWCDVCIYTCGPPPPWC